MKNIAVYPGSFDPFTLGHLDIIKRTSILFEKLIVAVVINLSKKHMLDADTRVSLIIESTSEFKNVEVQKFDGLLVNFVKLNNSNIVIRGLRAVSDFEYEFQMALMNKKLYPQFETLFIASNEKYSYLSSNIVKEIYTLNGKIDCLVPSPVATYLNNLKLKNISNK